MPQLSPTLGYLVFALVLLCLLMMAVSLKTTSQPLHSNPKSKLSSVKKAFIIFSSWDGSLNA
uniref:ATP synthase complex subunit 8 n=1 Tax=Trimusculus reticulatus TaxID=981059 RepID=G8HTF9_9EUPU|nr:ATP synthase F0 subunit 8 [Trimusculus reticulatus]AEQ93937.1 ATP synthase subunit 8 [Trimusculus reticulatus]